MDRSAPYLKEYDAAHLMYQPRYQGIPAAKEGALRQFIATCPHNMGYHGQYRLPIQEDILVLPPVQESDPPSCQTMKIVIRGICENCGSEMLHFPHNDVKKYYDYPKGKWVKI